MQVLLQIVIMLTGNYNFVNILTIVMAMALLDVREDTEPPATSEDQLTATRAFLGRLNNLWQVIQQNTAVGLAFLGMPVVYCVYSVVEVFAVGYTPPPAHDTSTSTWEHILSGMWIRFTPTVEGTQA